MTGLETILKQHDAVSVTANWKGSPNPKDWRNIRRICKCGTVIERHQIEQKPGRSYPLGGFPFDPLHRAHVADQIRGWLLSEAQKFDPSDDYHQTRADETDLNARAYYAGIDRVCALIEGRISTWTDAPTIAYELDDQTTTQET